MAAGQQHHILENAAGRQPSEFDPGRHHGAQSGRRPNHCLQGGPKAGRDLGFIPLVGFGDLGPRGVIERASTSILAHRGQSTDDSTCRLWVKLRRHLTCCECPLPLPDHRKLPVRFPRPAPVIPNRTLACPFLAQSRDSLAVRPRGIGLFCRFHFLKPAIICHECREHERD
jgi:hypothetical protein